MFDPSSFANPTPLAHADASRDVLPRGGTSQIVRVQYFVRGGFVGHRSRASSKHLSSHPRFLGGQTGVALQLQDARVGVGSTKKPTAVDVSEK
ncbi:uncharacterized protein TNCV_5032651 [Trichonephila clavipes]|nr:uncharacterized protein TNCV_5032651 [Trichonephila clavipes]